MHAVFSFSNKGYHLFSSLLIYHTLNYTFISCYTGVDEEIIELMYYSSHKTRKISSMECLRLSLLLSTAFSYCNKNLYFFKCRKL